MTHWCRDIPRDEAVRASEDGRSGPLPTLEECIGMIPKSVSATSAVEQENKGNDMGTKADRQAADYRREASAHGKTNHDAPPGARVSDRQCASPADTGADTAGSGLTERVTLEIRYDSGMFGWLPPGTWLEILKHPGTEFVRVVEETESLDRRHRWDRDGERCLKCNDKEWMGGPCNTTDAEYIEKLTAERDKLNRCPECNGEGKHDSGGTDASGEWINLPCDGCGATGTMHGYVEATDKLQASVDSLEEQLESVACRAATAENRVAELESAPAASGNVEKKPMKMPSREWFERMTSVDDSEVSVGGLAIRVAELESAPAARHLYDIGHEISHSMVLYSDQDKCSLEMKFRSFSDGRAFHDAMVKFFTAAPAASVAANSSGSPESSEPDAWGVRRKGGVDAVVHRLFRSSAEQSAEQYGGTVVPLFTSPPPARGWLTAEERGVLIAIHDQPGLWPQERPVIRALLARSTPPEVVLPGKPLTFRCGDDAIRNRDGQWIEALAAAGVKVKEVGRE